MALWDRGMLGGAGLQARRVPQPFALPAKGWAIRESKSKPVVLWPVVPTLPKTGEGWGTHFSIVPG